jgi:hypothetical protein
MWRLYGNQRGIALGFDTAAIVEASEHIIQSTAIDCLFLEPIRYGFDDAELAKRVLDSEDVTRKFAEHLSSMLQKSPSEFSISKKTFEKFIILSACSKLPDFSDEREIRLVALETGEGHENGRKRAAQPEPGRIVISYMDACRSVLVGPGPDADETVTQTRHLLDAHGFKDVVVIKSGTEFRFVRQGQ